MSDVARVSLSRVGIWTDALDMVSLSRAQELAAELEGLGFGAIWLPEVAGRDVFVHLALLLSATKRLVGATGIANIWARDAVTMTGAQKGLTEAFPERVLLGLGVSHHTLVQDLRGHRYEHPLTAMLSYLDAIETAPYTAVRPSTPVRTLLAALGPKMLELSARRSEGAHTFLVPPEHTHAARLILGDDRLLCPEQAVLLETNGERARQIAREHIAVYVRLPNYQSNLRRLGFSDVDFVQGGSNRLVDSIVAWGDEDTIKNRVLSHLDAGANHVCIQALPTTKRGVPVEQWRTLGSVFRDMNADGLSIQPGQGRREL